MTDADQDGAALYRRTVLAPLFAAARHHNAHYRRLDLAHAIALHEAGVLSRDDAAALLRGILRLVGALALDGRQDAGDFEDLFFLRENRLQALIGEDLAGRLHAGRSRNDIEATVFRLQMRERMGVLADGLAVLTGTMLDIAAREASTIILAYTHQQPAQPTTYGHYLAAFAEVLLRDLRRLHHAMDDLDACPLGAAAITTTGFPLDRARLAALLGFAAPQENSYGCIAGVYQCAAAYSALRLLALNIGRFTQDLAFWTSFEVG